MSFIQSVFKNYFVVWAVSPSSKFLYKKMISPIDMTHTIHIVEFWPGDGVFTDEILKKITHDSKLSIFEIDPLFIQKLQTKYRDEPRVTIYDVWAERSRNFFEKGSIDCVISWLPLAFIPKKIVSEILESAKSILKSHGKFIQFQYFLQNKKQIHQTFTSVHYKFTPLNFPPAFVYICTK